MKLRIVFSLISLMIIGVTFSVASAGKVQVKHINGNPIKGEIDKIDKEKLFLKKVEKEKSPKSLILRNLEEINFLDNQDEDAEDIEMQRDFEVFLVSGDVIFGKIERETQEGDGFMMNTLSFGKIPIRLDWVKRIKFVVNSTVKFIANPGVESKKIDAIYLAPKSDDEDNNNVKNKVDITVGKINGINEEGVDFSDAFGMIDGVVKWKKIMTVVFSRDSKPEIPRIFQVIVNCTSGEKFFGKFVALKDANWEFISPVLKVSEDEISDEESGDDAKIWRKHIKGLNVKINDKKLLKITFRYGNFAYLSDMKPQTTEEFPFFGGKAAVAEPAKYWWRYQLDKSVTGNNLVILDKNNHRLQLTKGIGVHSYSKLTFNLKDDYEEFKSEIGLAAGVGNKASIVFRVFVNEEKKPRYESPIMRKTAGYLAINVDISKAKKLHLEVDFADNGDIQDRAIWGRARVFKKKSEKAKDTDKKTEK